MNKPLFKIKAVSIAFVSCLSMISCSDDDTATTTPMQQEITKQDVQKSLKVDKMSNFIDDMTLDNIIPGKSISKDFSSKNPECTDVSVTDTGYTITFTDCTVGDGEAINGKIIVSNSIDANTVTSLITFEALSYGGNTINGSKTNSYTIDFQNGSFTYTTTSDLSITLADGTSASEKGTKTYEVTGLNAADGTYTMTGNWTVTVDQDTYILSTDPSLKGTFSCEYVTEGILTLGKSNMTASIDFGDGSCDNKATVTYPDGTSEEIEL